MHSRSILLAAASFSAISTTAWADALPQSGPAATRLEDVVVTADALGRSSREVVSNVAVLRGDELVQRRQSTLGETLTGLPGINSDTFGGGPAVRLSAARPRRA